jgi:aminoglycoside 2''-phosphotransferase
MPSSPDRLAYYVDRLRLHYPSLTVTTVERGAWGQNNDVLIVNWSLIVRFPRYRDGVDTLRQELCVLTFIGRGNALPIPRPSITSLDSPTPGDVFMGYPALPGVALSRECYAALSPDARQRAADSAATFLRRLHAQPVEAVLACGLEMIPPLQIWARLYDRIKERLFPLLTASAVRWTRDLFEGFLRAPEHVDLPLCLIHGDFGGSNILVDRQTGELTGVIDFSSAHLNDPAVDLAAASTIGSDFLQRLAHTYPVADTTFSRVAFYRGTFGLQEALFGVEAGDKAAVEAGLASIPGQ